jgi:hypothetical protein
MSDETTTQTPATAEPERSPAEEETPSRMHNFSDYVHVGPGAEACDCIKTVTDSQGLEFEAADGSCKNPDHFHGWVRLPNQFERKSIADKAAAAEARRLRALRDSESGDSVILDNEIESLVLAGDKGTLIDEIVGQNFLEDHIEAVKEIGEEDDGEWETIEEDRERLNSLRGRAPEDRDEEEFERLGDRIARHAELVNERRDAIQAPKRAAIADKPIEELGQIVRQARVDAMANGTRREEALKWEMYICTFKPKSLDKPGFPSERAFPSIDAFVGAAPEILEPIAQTVTTLNQESAAHLKG